MPMKEGSVDTFAKGEAAESHIDALIAKRDKEHRQTEGERAREALWAESVRRYNARQGEEIQAGWCEHFRRMRSVHSTLADEYDRKARALENGHHEEESK
jgi:hypothetical protein